MPEQKLTAQLVEFRGELLLKCVFEKRRLKLRYVFVLVWEGVAV
jgi:hypothetical protein